ncbi:hypothetical protein FO470_02345 [Starkeya sp. 3C]|jgi:hypothetical protein|uniref:Uncharacterized protein n=2 Tax=Hyphomicrobiales TaxID=356 RepID=A0ABY3DUN7_9HYPH|nr:hypothetical protein [Ancylobacter moscoviensis]TSJ64153.1 hypothetical protein FO470_02345 [Ancylobacter moscoviensis]
MISSTITLDAIRTMPVGEIAVLPADVLAILQQDADAALKNAKTLKDWLDGAIALKFGERARQARATLGKDTGTVRFSDGAVIIVADLPKKVEWDQGRLAALVETIRASGEDPTQYIEIRLEVSERAYGAWPDAIRRAFEPARTLKTGKPTFRLLRD